MREKQRKLIHAAMYMDRLVDRLRFRLDRLPYNHPRRENTSEYLAWSLAYDRRCEAWRAAGINWTTARLEFMDY